MRVLLIGNPDGELNRALLQVAEFRGHQVTVASILELSARFINDGLEVTGRDVAGQAFAAMDFEVLLMRAMPAGSLEQVVYRMDLLWSLEQAGLRVVNPPKAIECAIDKFLTLSRCRSAGLSVPPSSCCESVGEALEAFVALGQDVVCKPIFGAEGRGMVRLTDLETARRVFQAWEQIGAVILLQQFLNSEDGDLRVMVLDGDVLGAIRRTSCDQQEFRTNSAQSGLVERHELTDVEQQLAISACRATGVLFAGVDLRQDATGMLHVLEVNACPGWKHFSQATGINVPARLFDWLERTS